MDLYETLTHDMYRWAIEQYKEIFLGIGPQKTVAKNYHTYFWQLCNSMATFEGQYL